MENRILMLQTIIILTNSFMIATIIICIHNKYLSIKNSYYDISGVNIKTTNG